MPYRRKYRSTYRKRYTNKKKANSRMKAVINRVIRSKDEAKTIDVLVATSAPVAGAGIVVYLTGLVTGSTATGTRIGNEVSLVSIQMLGDIESQNSNDAMRGIARLILVRAVSSVTGTLPIILDILATNSYSSLRNTEKQQNYKVLWDKRYIFNANIANQSLIKPIEKFKSLGGLKCVFNGPLGDITAAETGGLYLVLITSETINNQHTWQINCRVTYKEL